MRVVWFCALGVFTAGLGCSGSSSTAASTTPAATAQGGSGAGGASAGASGAGGGSAAAGGAAGGGASGSGGLSAAADPTTLVVSTMGSGGFGYSAGNAFPGAAAPNGLAKVGPDTVGSAWGNVNFLHFDGYWYDDETIQGFSHLHMSGTGASDYGVLTVMPLDGFDASRTTQDGYGSTYKKASEKTSPGYYGVTLDTLAGGHIAVDITATVHAAHHRYTFPDAAPERHVLFDLSHHLANGIIDSAEVSLDPARQRVAGRLRSLGQMSGGFGGYDVYFVAYTKQPWTGAQLWQAKTDKSQPTTTTAPVDGTTAMGMSGTAVGFELAFDPAIKDPLEMRVGLSLVSADGAEANLAAEMPAFDFAGAQAASSGAWKTLLSRVRVAGGSDADQRTFYSSLYHAFMMPAIMSDDDGSYRLSDGMVHHADGYRFVSDISGWDIYRTVTPLYALAFPDQTRDLARSLTDFGKATGFLPKWAIAWGEAGTMIGAAAEIILSDFYQKGMTDFDAEGAYAILRAAAMDAKDPPGGRAGRSDVVAYMQYGYVPQSATVGGTASVTAEYARDDYALSNLARALGHNDDADALAKRATGYRSLFDPATGFLRPKDASGAWNPPTLNPTAFGADGFVEASAWQTVWDVPNDTAGLVALFGGQQPFIDKLTELFTKGKAEQDAIDPSKVLEIAKPRKWYFAGNEPDIHAGYMFAQAGRPDLTQQWVAWARSTFYSTQPSGLPGNDDGGTMSSWYVLSALGLFPLPGTDTYIIGTPLFPHAEIDLAGGTFSIDAQGVSPTAIYIQSATLNGAALGSPLIHHADLSPGGSLAVVMGEAPSAWGQTTN